MSDNPKRRLFQKSLLHYISWTCFFTLAWCIVFDVVNTDNHVITIFIIFLVIAISTNFSDPIEKGDGSALDQERIKKKDKPDEK